MVFMFIVLLLVRKCDHNHSLCSNTRETQAKQAEEQTHTQFQKFEEMTTTTANAAKNELKNEMQGRGEAVV